MLSFYLHLSADVSLYKGSAGRAGESAPESRVPEFTGNFSDAAPTRDAPPFAQLTAVRSSRTWGDIDGGIVLDVKSSCNRIAFVLTFVLCMIHEVVNDGTFFRDSCFSFL